MADDSTPDKRTPAEISWRVHLLRENIWRSTGLVAIMLVVAIGVWLWTGIVFLVLFCIGLLVASMAPYFFPVSYKMDRNGIEIFFIGNRNFRSWDEFRNFYSQDIGVHLSTLKRPGPLDPFRGSFIRFSRDNRDEVLRFLDEHIDRGKRDEKKIEPEG